MLGNLRSRIQSALWLWCYWIILKFRQVHLIYQLKYLSSNTGMYCFLAVAVRQVNFIIGTLVVSFVVVRFIDIDHQSVVPYLGLVLNCRPEGILEWGWFVCPSLADFPFECLYSSSKPIAHIHVVLHICLLLQTKLLPGRFFETWNWNESCILLQCYQLSILIHYIFQVNVTPIAVSNSKHFDKFIMQLAAIAIVWFRISGSS